MAHSLTEENYMKAIYGLSQKSKGKISLSALANTLEVNAASVVDMIKKLTDKKLINYDKVKGVKLTDKGSKVAINVVRNHRLWEVFLKEKLGYSWDVVHEIAEQLEHIKHDELADRLDDFLGYPEYDPHGDPIPKANGELPKGATTLLSEIKTGEYCKVAAVKDTSTAFLQYLEQLSVGIGTKIKVLEKIEFDGSVVIQLGKANLKTVSRKFAESLLVK
ncbi:MAG: metal-dependent transcriptional regulator [Bacteroidota bacterium]